jgi:hypothetical protein
MAINPKSPPLVQLFGALQAERIKFMLVGMSAANLQGVLASTVDVDVWIGLPPRQYVRVINLCHRLKATIQSPNKVFLSDELPWISFMNWAASRALKKNSFAPKNYRFMD